MKLAMTLTISLILIFSGILPWETICFAKEGKEMKHHMTEPKKHMMPGMSMKGMMGKTMVATEDGGLVVMVCNKLYKFDKDLNLTKEAEIPFDEAHMEKMMKRMNEMQTRMQKENRMIDAEKPQSQPK